MSDEIRDPSLCDGAEIAFDNEIPLTIRVDKEEEVKIVRFKIVVVKNKDDELTQVNIEIMCDSDLFLFFESKFTEDVFEKVKKDQELTIEFQEFAQMVIESLTQNAVSPDKFVLLFTESESGDKGVLEFKQTLKFKAVQIFALEFTPVSNEYLKEQIQYRFNFAKAALKSARTDLNDLYSMLKIKNPNVLKQMRTTHK